MKRNSFFMLIMYVTQLKFLVFTLGYNSHFLFFKETFHFIEGKEKWFILKMQYE